MDMHPPPRAVPAPDLSVVVPVHNEAGNLESLVEEIHAALDGHPAFEVVYVDDASDDDTPRRLGELGRRYPRLRVLRHRVNCGQSTAIATGVRRAHGRLVATLDGDGQNDPADLPVLLQRWDLEAGAGPDPLLLAGWRSQRRDTWLRRVSSRIANGVRSRLLGDATPDTGCGLKLFEREAYLALPFFDHMHRFLPALFLRAGGRVVSVPVRHRPRLRGSSHYGVWNRLWVGIVDLFGVAWLRRRIRLTAVDETATASTALVQAAAAGRPPQPEQGAT
jgi:glycosyltransferase involved in cell wall biosynthesis